MFDNKDFPGTEIPEHILDEADKAIIAGVQAFNNDPRTAGFGAMVSLDPLTGRTRCITGCCGKCSTCLISNARSLNIKQEHNTPWIFNKGSNFDGGIKRGEIFTISSGLGKTGRRSVSDIVSSVNETYSQWLENYNKTIEDIKNFVAKNKLTSFIELKGNKIYVGDKLIYTFKHYYPIIDSLTEMYLIKPPAPHFEPWVEDTLDKIIYLKLYGHLPYTYPVVGVKGFTVMNTIHYYKESARNRLRNVGNPGVSKYGY